MDFNIRPVLAPQDIAATGTRSASVDLANLNWCTFLVHFGNIAATSADQAVTVTLEASTVTASTSASAIAFNYRQSGIHTANTWGAYTAATSSGVSVATTDDNTIFEIQVDPAYVSANKTDGRWVAVMVTPDAGGTATLVGITVIGEPRYPGATMTVST